MLSQAISLRRLRLYEMECRRGRAEAQSALTKNEFSKFEESFRRAAMELQAVGAEAGQSDNRLPL
jgi:hypothetical protein